MELSKKAKEALQNIQRLFGQAETELNKLTNAEKEEVLNYHKEHYSIDHCVRWGQQASTELIRSLEDDSDKGEEVADDLQNYIDEYLEEIAESHLDVWKNRYVRKKVEDVVFDLRVNHDKSADIEAAEDRLNRKLTDEERTYFYDAFVTEVERIYYV